MRVTDCRDVCEASNMLVVSPSAAGRAAGGRPVWLGFVGDLETVGEIADWLDAGGPGSADPPQALKMYEFKPPRRVCNETGFADAKRR